MDQPFDFTIQTPSPTIAEVVGTQKARCRKRKAENDAQETHDEEAGESLRQDVDGQVNIPERKGLHPIASFNLVRERVLYSVHTTLRDKLRTRQNFQGKMHQMVEQLKKIEAKTQQTYDEANKLLEEEDECYKTLEDINRHLDENASQEVISAELRKLKSQLTSPRVLLMLRQSMTRSLSYTLPVDEQSTETPSITSSSTNLLLKKVDEPQPKADTVTSWIPLDEKPNETISTFPTTSVGSGEKDGKSNPFGLFGKKDPASTCSSAKVSFPGIPESKSTDSANVFGKPLSISAVDKKDTPFSFGALKPTDSGKSSGDLLASSHKKDEESKPKNPFDVFGKPYTTTILEKKDTPFTFGSSKSKDSVQSTGDSLASSDKKEESKPENPFSVFGKPSSTPTLAKEGTAFSFGASKPSDSEKTSENSLDKAEKTESPSKPSDPFKISGSSSFTTSGITKDSPFSFGATKTTDSVKAPGDANKTEDQTKSENPLSAFGKPSTATSLEKKETPFSFGAPQGVDVAKSSENPLGSFEKKDEPSKPAEEPLFKKPASFGLSSSTQESTTTISQGMFSTNKPFTFGGSTESSTTATASSGFSNAFTTSTENKGSLQGTFGSNPFGQTVQTPMTPADASSAFIQAFQTNSTPTLSGTAPSTSAQNGLAAPASSGFTLPQNPGESLFQLSPQTFNSSQGTATGSLKPTRRFGDQGKRKRR